MRKSLFKKMSAAILSLTLVVGMTAAVPAAVKTGTDISNGVKWQGFSIHTREDKGKWEDELKKAGQVYNNQKDAFKSYGENAKISSQTSTNVTMNVTSTGYSAHWKPDGTVAQSNPWGVTLNKILKIEKGRTYTISFKIKSTLQNEIKETKTRKDGTGYNVGTGKMNYVKHIHLKAYRNHEKDGDPAIKFNSIKATYKGASVLSKTKDYSNFIKLDSRNDDYVDVIASVTVPGDNIAYKQNTMGVMLAMGAFLKEFPNENDMKGVVDVKDFKVVAGSAALKANKVSKVKPNAKKGTMKVSLKKVKGAKGYEVQYFTSYDKSEKTYSGKKTVKAKKATVTIKNKKKIKAKKTLYVRARYYKTVNGKKTYSVWSALKKVKIKK